MSRNLFGKGSRRQRQRVKQVVFDQPGTYHIQIQGQVPEKWSAGLGGMQINREPGDPQVTTLTGRLPDQGALVGVLVHLYDLHLPVISVAVLDTED